MRRKNPRNVMCWCFWLHLLLYYVSEVFDQICTEISMLQQQRNLENELLEHEWILFTHKKNKTCDVDRWT